MRNILFCNIALILVYGLLVFFLYLWEAKDYVSGNSLRLVNKFKFFSFANVAMFQIFFIILYISEKSVFLLVVPIICDLIAFAIASKAAENTIKKSFECENNNFGNSSFKTLVLEKIKKEIRFDFILVCIIGIVFVFMWMKTFNDL